MIYNLMCFEAGVSKAYVIVTLMICMSFTGCIEDAEEEENVEEEDSALKDSFDDFVNSLNTENWRKYCKYTLYTVDDETNTIILANNTVLDECVEEEESYNDNYEYKITVSNYHEENLDYRAANNSGFVYSVNITVEDCQREDEFEPWKCETLDVFDLWVKVSGQWLLWYEGEEETEGNSGSAPIARINPSNPKIQINETISFRGSDSTDSDGDTLTFTWIFEGDSQQYEGENIERHYPDKGEFYVNLLVTDSTGLTDEAETTVSVVEDYHGEASGDVDEGESDQIEFPVESGVVSLYITWSLDDKAELNPIPSDDEDGSSVNLMLNDAQGNNLENEMDVQEGDGSWSISSESLGAVGDYEFIIEGESGSMSYEVTIDVSY